MDSFRTFAGFLSFIFGAIFVSSVIWTAVQVGELDSTVVEQSREIATAEGNKEVAETSIYNSRVSIQQSEKRQASKITECIRFNVEENRVSETESTLFCNEEYSGYEKTLRDTQSKNTETFTEKLLEAEADLAAAQITIESLQLARPGLLSAGVTLSITVFALWGVFQLAYLVGKHLSRR